MNNTSIEIRQEKATDYPAVYNIHSKAFGRKDEARLTDRLRLSDVFVPDSVFMGLELVENAFSGVKGLVQYAREFQEI